MKKFILFVIILNIALFSCGCSTQDTLMENEAVSGDVSIGQVLSVSGIGDFTVKKIHTTPVIYSTIRHGTFFECENADNVYIDVVLRFKNKKQTLSPLDLGYVKAVGKTTGKDFSDSLVLVEKDENIGLSATDNIEAAKEVTLHMAVEVPAESADETYKIELGINKNVYEFEYKKGELICQENNVYEGQSLSNSRIKAKLDECSYSTYLYEKAPHVCDAPEDSVYLVTRFKVMNKSFEEKNFKDILSAYVVYDDCTFETKYLMSESEDKDYVSEGVIPGISEAYIIAFTTVPYEYASKDAKIIFAIDHEEFSTKVFGTENFSKRVEIEEIETTAPIVQEEPENKEGKIHDEPITSQEPSDEVNEDGGFAPAEIETENNMTDPEEVIGEGENIQE